MKPRSVGLMIMVLLLFAGLMAPLMAAELQAPSDEAVMPDWDLSSVAGIIALTAFITQWVKPLLPKVPAKALAVAIGAILTALALFVTHSIGGPLQLVFLQVILGVLGAPAAYEIIGGR